MNHKKPRHPRTRPARAGVTMHASQGLAPALAAIFQRLASGTPAQRAAAEEFRQGLRAMKGGAA